MTAEEKTFLTDVQRRAHQLAALFGVVVTQNEGNVRVAAAAGRGGRLALELCSLAGDRVLGAEHAAELAAGNYDLAALAMAPPPAVEE